jgi:hypothetical protein
MFSIFLRVVYYKNFERVVTPLSQPSRAPCILGSESTNDDFNNNPIPVAAQFKARD